MESSKDEKKSGPVFPSPFHLGGRQMTNGEIKVEKTFSMDSQDEASVRKNVVSTSSEASHVIRSVSSEDDDEIKKAKAMALAIQNNPNVSPEEIQKLLVDGGYETQKGDESVPSMIPGRLTNLLSSSIPPLSTDATKSFRDRARRLNEIFSGGINSSKSSDNSESVSESVKESVGLKRGFRGKNIQARTPPVSPTPTDGPVVIQAPGTSGIDPPFATAGRSRTTSYENVSKITPIRISGIAWKRRGGMGKFSTTAAWERRRIELQGTKLLYYSRDISEEDSVNQEDDHSLPPQTPQSLLEDEQSPEGVVIAKRATWLEQAAHNWVAGSDDPTSPRGFIDLAKDKASVHVSYGDNGAPSPFAISIKVRGETKWKLCFDYHRTQMDWLAALTDVVVQTSVDNYNALLLQATDPSHQSEHVMFRPPTMGEPPSKDTGSAHRLWMTESYIVSSDESQPNTATSNSRSLASSLNQRADPKPKSVNRQSIEEIIGAVSKTRCISDNNILYVFGVLNLSLVYARKSSTTTESFWYLVLLSNLGLYLCMNFIPDWKSCIDKCLDADQPLNENNVAGSAGREIDATDVPTSIKDKVDKQGSGYIPQAGCSTIRIENPKDEPLDKNGEIFCAYRVGRGEDILVRSQGYSSTKVKVPSPGELYELMCVDAFESPQRCPDMTTRVKLPKVHFDDKGPKTWKAPDTFVISLCLPTDPPKFGASTNDGGGFTITLYLKMKQETRDILKRVTAEGYDPSSEKAVDDPQKSCVNAVRLLDQWCRRAPTDPKFFSRFKIVPHGHNLAEVGLPGWISTYNGKPFLIKRQGQTGFIYDHPEISAMVFEVSLHPFPFLAKKALCYMKENFCSKMHVSVGFLIEGREDDELPECLIGLFQLCYADPLNALKAKDFLDGTGRICAQP